MIKIRAFTASAILAAIGSLFLLKYGARYTSSAPIAAVTYFAFLVALVTFTNVIRQRVLVRIGRMPYVIFLAIITSLAGYAVYLLPAGDAVSRLPAITIWLHKFLDGRFPYGNPINPSSVFPFSSSPSARMNGSTRNRAESEERWNLHAVFTEARVLSGSGLLSLQDIRSR